MRRKIYTKRESFQGVLFYLLFAAIWYTNIISVILENYTPAIIIFLVSGVLPLIAAIQKIRSAIYYRELHRKCMQTTPRRGKIIDCHRQYYQEKGSRGSVRTRVEYILTVEVYSSNMLSSFQIKSAPYSWPVYRVLAYPDVDVYTDETGWRHVIDGFQYKTSKKDPDIFVESSFDKAPETGENWLYNFIVIIVMFLALLHVLLN